MKTLSTLALFLLAAVAGCTRQALQAPRPASVKSFTASAAEVNAGETVTLRWEVEDATSLAIVEQGKGALPGVTLSPEGTVEVKIDNDSVFLLTAGGEGGADLAAVAVAIRREEPSALFSAIPVEITAGEPTTLVWNARAASAVVLTANGENLNIDNRATGSLTLRPVSTTDYELTADGRKSTVRVTVNTAIFSFESSRAAAEAGAQITLSWKTAGGAKLVLTSPGRGDLLSETDSAKILTGSFADTLPANLPDNANVRYTLALTQGERVVQRELVVHVGANPQIVRFDVPAVAQAGGLFTVAWATTNAERVQVSLGGQVLFEAPDAASVAQGSAVIPTPPAKSAVTLLVTNARGGTASLSKDVEPITDVSFVRFQADKTTVANAGEPVTLSWEVKNARHVRIDLKNQLVLKESFGASVGTGSLKVFPSTTTEYVLVADNQVGSALTPVAVKITVTQAGKITLSPESAPLGQNISVTGHTVPGGGDILNLPNAKKDQAGEAFIDIANAANDIHFDADADLGAELVTLSEGFTGVIYGTPVNGTSISVSINGWFVFATQPIPGSDTALLPSTSLEPLAIAPYLADLRATQATKIFLRSDGADYARRIIIQWQDVERKDSPGSKLTFQAQLHTNGKLVFAYKEISGLVMGATYPSIGVMDPNEDDALLAPGVAPAVGGTYTLFGPTALPFTLKASATPYWMLVGVSGGFVALPTATKTP